MSAVSDVPFGRSQLDSLIEALVQVPGLADRDARDARVEQLRNALRREFEPPRSADTRTDLESIVLSGAACSGGLRTLAKIVSRHHPGEVSSHLIALSNDIIGPALLSPQDRDALRRLLVEISIVDIADAVHVLGEVPELGSLQVWRDMPMAIRHMERLPLPDRGVPPLLTFVSRLADIEEGDTTEQLRDWLGTVSGGLITENARSAAVRPGLPRQTPTRPAMGHRTEQAADHGHARPRRIDESGLIWSGVPIRNRNFTGRVALLDRLGVALQSGSTASVLPQTLQGLGGVGKTQLVVEFVYRHLDEYDLIWWIPAEQTATVLTSLTKLAERLGAPVSEDSQETARIVLDALAGSDLAWLLVYDNADEPGHLGQLLPSTGGHVIVTTRVQEWSEVGVAIEVDVFKRDESIELLSNRSRDEQGNVRINATEADELAERLGDLPLALEQAAAWYLATGMPVREYIDLLDTYSKELLDEGRPANYPETVAAFVALAIEKLRETAQATAQLFALFAFLGGEPIPLAVLRSGGAAVAEPLRNVLGASIPMNRTVRDLSRYGLAKVDPLQRIQVHRLVQLVLRQTLDSEQRQEALRNVQNLLAEASPGDPDELGGFDRQRDLGPHIEPAALIHSENLRARQAVLDHSRFLYLSGDYENSRYLAERAAKAWAEDTSHERLGPDGELTLMAWAQVANATRTLGKSREAAQIMQEIYPRFLRSALLGPNHEFTLITGNQVGYDLRIAGRYDEALEFDRQNVSRHVQVFETGKTYTLRAQLNLAVDHRMIGEFAEALAVDREVVGHLEDVGGLDVRALSTYMNMARNYYGLGAYGAAMELLERWRSVLQEMVGPGHSQVLIAGRTYGITLRKMGRLADAVEVTSENFERTQKRFGMNHEFSNAAAVSYANVLREAGEAGEAIQLITEALERYREDFGETHPLTLVAQVNEAIARRANGELSRARELDEYCVEQLGRVLGINHPYAICAGTSLATDLARAGNHEEALDLSRMVYSRSQASYAGGEDERDGATHPYLLMRAINLAHDMRATGDSDAGDQLLQDSIAGLRQALRADHPEVLAAERGERLEGDIEPPPT
jgi:tetratricopeptide (TPR) repeat protein